MVHYHHRRWAAGRRLTDVKVVVEDAGSANGMGGLSAHLVAKLEAVGLFEALPSLHELHELSTEDIEAVLEHPLTPEEVGMLRQVGVRCEAEMWERVETTSATGSGQGRLTWGPCYVMTLQGLGTGPQATHNELRKARCEAKEEPCFRSPARRAHKRRAQDLCMRRLQQVSVEVLSASDTLYMAEQAAAAHSRALDHA